MTSPKVSKISKSKAKLQSSIRLKTRTPTAELGGSSNTPVDSDGDDGSFSARDVGGKRDLNGPAPDDDDTLGTSREDRSEEIQRLLGGGHVPRRVASKGNDWVSTLGFEIPRIPRGLLYLLLLPPAILTLALVFRLRPVSHLTLPTLSNGTHSYNPTTLLISLDGFRPSYLTSHPHLVPHLLALSNSTLGLRAESMQPRFPTQTFPNHWSIMTGLYPESHGIIANEFWDPVGKREFVYTKQEHSWDGDWWWGEPLWSVVERGGLRSANIMWPGPPTTTQGISASFFVSYGKMKPVQKLAQVFDWLDMPIHSRPHLITTYIPNVDQMGHKGGPESAEVEEALSLVDDFVGGVVDGLALRNLSEIVNVIIVSDHGMTSTANERLIFLDKVLGEQAYNDLEHRDGWPSVGLRFREGAAVDDYLQILLDAAEQSEGFDVYTHQTMPERWHFNATSRIAPILMVPKLGWAITDDHEHKVINKGDYSPKGNHGYDNIEEDMQAIFFAHGPFAKSLKDATAQSGFSSKRGWLSTEPHVMQSFSNLEIFSLVVRLLGLEGIEPPHNGTIGFWDQYVKHI